MLLVFPTVLLLFLGIGQLTLLWGAKLAVKHAASAAVRAAVVVLDDDPRLYGGEARNAVPVGSIRRGEILRAAAGRLTGSGTEMLAANPDIIFEGLLASRDRNQPMPALLTPTAGLFQALRIFLPGNDGGGFGLRDLVTVRVEHDFSCLVPFARYIVCGTGSQVLLAEQASLPNQGAPYDYLGPVSGTPYTGAVTTLVTQP
jgi:hypothetical protein